MAELVDAGDLKSPGLYGCAGSIPALGTFFTLLISGASELFFFLEKVRPSVMEARELSSDLFKLVQV